MQYEGPKEWRLVTLKELGEVNRGRSRHRPRYAEHLYGGPYPFIQTGDVKASNGRITSYTQTYSEAGLAQSRLWPINTMCITIAANIAETGILTFPACFPDSVVGFIANPEKANVDYIEFTFRFMRNRIQQQATGSVQDNINIETLERLRFPLPPLSEQRAIAHVLGSLDDKIEFNRQTNETLEEMARTLFRSWFVDFDPVHAKAAGRQPEGMDAETAALFPSEFVESELGMIPKGWRVASIEYVAENLRRPADPRSYSAETPYVGLEHMPRRSIALGEWAGASDAESNKFAFYRGEILFGKLRPYFHKVGVAINDGICSTDILVVAPKHPKWFGLLLGHLSSDRMISHVTAAADGTRMPRANWSDIAGYKIALPPDDVAKLFTEEVMPITNLIREHLLEQRWLTETRNELLPKLISGEVRLPEDMIAEFKG